MINLGWMRLSFVVYWTILWSGHFSDQVLTGWSVGSATATVSRG